MQQLLQLVYSSVPTKAVDSAILDIVRSAEHRNERMAISGMLYFGKLGYIQMLEGPSAAVTELFESIRSDDRHRVTQVISRKIDMRHIGQALPMGYEARLIDSRCLYELDRHIDETIVSLVASAQSRYPRAAACA